jgi:hypothetical protein
MMTMVKDMNLTMHSAKAVMAVKGTIYRDEFLLLEDQRSQCTYDKIHNKPSAVLQSCPAADPSSACQYTLSGQWRDDGGFRDYHRTRI